MPHCKSHDTEAEQPPPSNSSLYSCYFGLDGTPGGDPTTKDLGQAEIAMNKLYAERAKLEEGQDVLELGCGWGSFSLWAAETYPKSNFTAVSNSATQREHIEGQCKKRNITNLKVITCDMNVFQAEGKFDRVISIEMVRQLLLSAHSVACTHQHFMSLVRAYEEL
jgi:cyclopropane-fatty-acyl-phospholipid synthase